MIVGWVFLLVTVSILSEMVSLGFGVSTIGAPNEEPMRTLVLVADNCHKISLGLTKSSFAVTMMRLTTGRYRYLILGLLVTINVVYVLNIILSWMSICQLRPISGIELPGSCWSSKDSPMMLNIFSACESLSSAISCLIKVHAYDLLICEQFTRHSSILSLLSCRGRS